MRFRFTTIALMLMLCAATVSQAQIAPVPQLMNFQGRLAKPDGVPVADGNYSVRFSLWTAQTGGTEKWNQTLSPVAVRNGVFAVLLNTSLGAADKFNGNLFLEIKVGSDPALTPRQQLTSVAYAMKADSIKDGSITGASIANGTITANKLANGIFNPLAWLLNGNSGVTSGFLGTTDNHPLTMKVNNRRAMLYTYSENTETEGEEFRSINALGGSEINSIGAGVVGATVSGGGFDSFSGLDSPNLALGDFSTVGGGFGNTASGFSATVAGGSSNTASGNFAFVAGSDNTASGTLSTVLGVFNFASGPSSIVAGGTANVAAGTNSFAAGRHAKALQDGTFVWADNQSPDFASTAPNQFLIRAAGGVGIGTTVPSHALTVQSGINTMRLIGPNSFGSGAKFNFGDADFAFIQEDTDDSLLIHARLNVRVEGTLVNASDGRWKQDVAPLDNPLDTVLALRGVSYQWRHDIPGKNFPDGKQIGFIAQEVEKVLPELVATDDKGYKAVSYVNVVPVLVEAIKQQQTQIKTQQKQIDKLNALKDENTELKRQMAEIYSLVKTLQNNQETQRSSQTGTR